MLKLFILNIILVGLSVIGALLCRKHATTDRAKRKVLIIVSLSIVACHYSQLLIPLFTKGNAWDNLNAHPNLLLPIYPCNVVMWSCVILAFVKFRTKVSEFLIDYVLLFGIFSTLVGMFANVDFINNPTLLDYDVTMGIITHGVMFFYVILIPALGLFKLDFRKNLLHIFVSIVVMFLAGFYCNTVCRVIGSESYAYSVNSMFILHSPFDNVPFLTYPTIAGLALVGYAIVLFVWYTVYKKVKAKNN